MLRFAHYYKESYDAVRLLGSGNTLASHRIVSVDVVGALLTPGAGNI
jgi:hypothetical protein